MFRINIKTFLIMPLLCCMNIEATDIDWSSIQQKYTENVNSFKSGAIEQDESVDNIDTWLREKTYSTAGNIVKFTKDDKIGIFRNAWWTKGEEPNFLSDSGVWKLVKRVDADGNTLSAKEVVESWNPTIAYNGNAIVNHDIDGIGYCFKAKYWTQNNEPFLTGGDTGRQDWETPWSQDDTACNSDVNDSTTDEGERPTPPTIERPIPPIINNSENNNTTTDNNTTVSTILGVSKNVKGWPKYLAMGTVTDNASAINDKLAASKIDAIFKYAGNGFGNRGEIIDPTVTLQTINQAREVENIANKKIMPTMVVYTANGSGGGVAPEDILEKDNLVAHYRTLIRMAVEMEQSKDTNHPNPATIVLNPDLFGEWQKNKTDTYRGSFQVNYCNDDACQNLTNIDIKNSLKEAIEAEKEFVAQNGRTITELYDIIAINSSIDNDIEDNIKGWVQSQNFIIKTFSENVPFAWVINLWNPGSALWVHKDILEVKKASSSVVDFVNFIEAYKDNAYRPDFLVFDKYERDGFGAAGKPYYAFGSKEWDNYLLYVKDITDNIKTPSMLWQIPGGHMVSKTEDLSGEAKLCSEGESNGCFRHLDDGAFGGHSATGGSYFMGDKNIGTNIDNIRDDVLAISLTPSIYNGAQNVRELISQESNYDWAKPALNKAIDANAFSILWGGGETTGTSPISTNQTGGYAWLSRAVSEYENSARLSVDGNFSDENESSDTTVGGTPIIPPLIPKPPVEPTVIPEEVNVDTSDLPADGYGFLKSVTDENWNWIFPLRFGKYNTLGGTNNKEPYAKEDGSTDVFSLDNFKKAVLFYNTWAKLHDYKQFLNEGTDKQQAQEFLIFWAKSSRETSGSWGNAPAPWIIQNSDGTSVWKGGLYWVEELGFTTNGDGTSPHISYVDSGSSFTPYPNRSYHGRGIIQLSWNYNYGAFSAWLYDNNIMSSVITSRDTLLKYPNLVKDNGTLSILSGIWFWMTPQGPKPSSHDVVYGNVYNISTQTQEMGLPPRNDNGQTYTAMGDTVDQKVMAYRIGTVIDIVNGGIECNRASAWHSGPLQRVSYYNAYAQYFNTSYPRLNTTIIEDAINVWDEKVSDSSSDILKTATCYSLKSYFGW